MDIGRIEEYNRKLEEYQRQSAEAQSSVKFHAARVQESCQQLTRILGIEVTPENLQQVYEDYQKKVENTLQTGEEIMRRIDEQKAQVGVRPATQGAGQPMLDFAAPSSPVAQMAPVQVPMVGSTESEPTPIQVPVAPMGAEPMPIQVPVTGLGPAVGFDAPEAPTTPPVGHVWGQANGQGIRQATGPVNI